MIKIPLRLIGLPGSAVDPAKIPDGVTAQLFGLIDQVPDRVARDAGALIPDGAAIACADGSKDLAMPRGLFIGT